MTVYIEIICLRTIEITHKLSFNIQFSKFGAFTKLVVKHNCFFELYIQHTYTHKIYMIQKEQIIYTWYFKCSHPPSQPGEQR